MAPPCCSCYGWNAACKRCVCVRAGCPCKSCLPLKGNHCNNVLSSRVAASVDFLMMGINKNSSSGVANHVITVTTALSPTLAVNDHNNSQSPLAPLDCEGSGSISASDSNSPNLPNHNNNLFLKAYGAPLVHSDGGTRQSQWCERWSKVVHHKGLLYSLPSGSIGKRYVHQLTEELTYLCNGTFSAQRILVFSSVLLQRDRSVSKLVIFVDFWNDALPCGLRVKLIY